MDKRPTGERSYHGGKVEAIMAGAMQEFLASGYAATSVDRVAAAAGVSKSTLYTYFRDKEELFTALIQQVAQKKLLPLFDLQVTESEPEVALRQIATQMMASVAKDEMIIPVMQLLLAEAVRFPEIGKLLVENLDKPGFAMISRYLAAHPELNVPDPEATARIFVGSLVHFMIVHYGMYGREIIPMDPTRLVESLIHLITARQDHRAKPS